MNILIRILHWLGMKTVVIVMIVVVLTGASFVINWIKANRISESHVAALQQQVFELKTKVANSNRNTGVYFSSTSRSGEASSPVVQRWVRNMRSAQRPSNVMWTFLRMSWRPPSSMTPSGMAFSIGTRHGFCRPS